MIIEICYIPPSISNTSKSPWSKLRRNHIFHVDGLPKKLKNSQLKDCFGQETNLHSAQVIIAYKHKVQQYTENITVSIESNKTTRSG